MSTLMLLALALTACEDSDGDAQAGARLIREHGCAACHVIPGIAGANGIVGPSLRDFGSRTYIGGVHPNTPENLVLWIADAPEMSPSTGMPDMNIPQDQARHIAVYLHSLR